MGTFTRKDSGAIIASIWYVGNRLHELPGPRRYRASSFAHGVQPSFPCLLRPWSAGPNNFAPHRILGIIYDEFNELSRFSLKVPRNRNPSCDLSTMRHGSNVCFPSRL